MVCAFLLSAAGAPAENWVYAKATGGALGYETTQIERDAEGGTVNGYLFLYLSRPLANNGVTYSFQEIEADFDCRAPRWRPVSTVLFDKAGKELGEFAAINDNWLPVEDNTPWDIVRAAYCDGANLEDSRTATSEDEAFLGAIAISEQ